MFKRLFNKLFLVKEIVSREGVVHFRRWRLIATPFFSIYIHCISQSDKDKDPHDHPWSFASLILKGTYAEISRRGWTKSEEKYFGKEGYSPYTFIKGFTPGSWNIHNYKDVHKIELKTPSVWTLVFVGRRKHFWGYLTDNGWVDHMTYRKQKYSGEIDE